MEINKKMINQKLIFKNKKGATDTFKGILVGLVLFVIFTYAIITIAVNFGAEYGKSSIEIGGGSLNLTEFQDSADSVNNSAQSYRQRFEEGEVDNVDDARGVFHIVTDMFNMITTPFRLLSQIAVNMLGIPALFVNVILGLLAITLILAVWSLLKKGD